VEGIWEVMRDFVNFCLVLIKLLFLLRDIELMKELVEVIEFIVNFLVLIFDEKVWCDIELYIFYLRKRLVVVIVG